MRYVKNIMESSNTWKRVPYLLHDRNRANNASQKNHKSDEKLHDIPYMGTVSGIPAETYLERTYILDGRIFCMQCRECFRRNDAQIYRKSRLVRKWICSKCGAEHDRDINAAKNMLAEGLVYQKYFKKLICQSIFAQEWGGSPPHKYFFQNLINSSVGLFGTSIADSSYATFSIFDCFFWTPTDTCHAMGTMFSP